MQKQEHLKVSNHLNDQRLSTQLMLYIHMHMLFEIAELCIQITNNSNISLNMYFTLLKKI